MTERKRLSTGFIRAAGYADKLRRTMIAITKGILKPDEAARAAAQINMRLFDVLRDHDVAKGDVVRIMFEFDILEKDGSKEVSVDWDSLTIEVYKSDKVIKGSEIKSELPTYEMLEYSEEIEKKLKELATEYTKSSGSTLYMGDKWIAEIMVDEKTGEKTIRLRYRGSEKETKEFINKLKGE